VRLTRRSVDAVIQIAGWNLSDATRDSGPQMPFRIASLRSPAKGLLKRPLNGHRPADPRTAVSTRCLLRLRAVTRALVRDRAQGTC